jgi:hypothetical protein
MKFLTPELYAKFQATDDASMDAADAEWEVASEHYNQRFDAIRDKLPKNLLEFLDAYYLHDADILRLARSSDLFVIELRPDWPPRDLILLQYSLIQEPVIDTEALPEQHRTSHVQWMYDELDYVESQGCVSHAIMLSNGWTLDLRFREIKIIVANDLLSAADQSTLPSQARTA